MHQGTKRQPTKKMVADARSLLDVVQGKWYRKEDGQPVGDISGAVVIFLFILCVVFLRSGFNHAFHRAMPFALDLFWILDGFKATYVGCGGLMAEPFQPSCWHEQLYFLKASKGTLSYN